MYQDENKNKAERDHNLMQVYLRSQSGRAINHQKMGWFFDQPELIDDGDHPLLEDVDSQQRYSRAVMRRAFTSWAQLDNKNPFKFLCNYYHVLEKMGENAPMHVRDYVQRALEVPSFFHEIPDQIFSQDRHAEFITTGSPYECGQNIRPCFYKHCHVESNYGKNQPSHGPEVARNYGGTGFVNPIHDINGNIVLNQGLNSNCGHDFDLSSETRAGPTNVYEKYCQFLAYKLYGPSNEQKIIDQSDVEGVKATIAKDKCELVCQSQTSIDSTPSKGSEDDSCYQSMTSPMTEHED